MEQIILEEIYGNMAKLYHYSPTDELQYYLKNGMWKMAQNAGNMYGPGVYTCYDKDSTNPDYGGYLYKFYIKGIRNFFIFEPEIYNKVYGTSYNNDNDSRHEIIKLQNKKFNLDVKDRFSFTKSQEGKYAYGKDRERISGIIFEGGHDGYVCVVWNPYSLIPISFSRDNGETWKKIPKNKKYNKAALEAGNSPKNTSSKPRYNEKERNNVFFYDTYTLTTNPGNDRYTISNTKSDHSVIIKFNDVYGNNSDDNANNWKIHGYNSQGLKYRVAVTTMTLKYKDDNKKVTFKSDDPEDAKTIYLELKNFPSAITGRIINKDGISIAKLLKTYTPEKEENELKDAKEKFGKEQQKVIDKYNKNRKYKKNAPYFKDFKEYMEKYVKYGKKERIPYYIYKEENGKYIRDIDTSKKLYKTKLIGFSLDHYANMFNHIAPEVNGGTSEDDLKPTGLLDYKKINNSKIKSNKLDVNKFKSELGETYGKTTKAYMYECDGKKFILAANKSSSSKYSSRYTFIDLGDAQSKVDGELKYSAEIDFMGGLESEAKQLNRFKRDQDSDDVRKVNKLLKETIPEEINVSVDWKIEIQNCYVTTDKEIYISGLWVYKPENSTIFVPSIEVSGIEKHDSTIDDFYKEMEYTLNDVSPQYKMSKAVMKKGYEKMVDLVRKITFEARKQGFLMGTPVTKKGKMMKHNIETFGRDVGNMFNEETNYFNY